MVKAVIFDLDGVLIETDKWHWAALNIALQAAGEEPLSWLEHLEIYKGRPTLEKLRLMEERRGLDPAKFDEISDVKQAYTLQMIGQFSQPDEEKREMMRLLRNSGYRIAVCSNAIAPSVELMLDAAGLSEFVEFFLSNQDVDAAKPAPDIYLKAFERLGIAPHEAVVVEDSDVGQAAARASGAFVCPVADESEVNYYRVLAAIQRAQEPTVLIPAAGQGKRFVEVGYQHPKPLIDVEGRPMLSHVLDDFAPLEGRTVILMQERHIDRYCAREIIGRLRPGTVIVGVDGLTQGAACTLLLAEPELNPSAELIIANSDQTVDVDLREFVGRMRAEGADGGILTFRDTNPKWSFARTDEDGRVVEVAEKRPISDQATVGIYYWRRAGDFIRCAKQMVSKDIRTNGEFYVCPVFNEIIAEGGLVLTHEIPMEAMHGLGTPEDLERYLARPAARTAVSEVPHRAGTPVS